MAKRVRHRRANSGHEPGLFDARAAAVEGHAQGFAQALRRAAEIARREEEIRIAIERQLERIGADLGIAIEGQHEFLLLRGQVDSVYGSVFIEYKNPASDADRLGARLSTPGTRAVVEQIKRRFAAVKQMVGNVRGGLLGIGCDGRYFVFCRFFDGNIEVEEPVELSPWSAKRFLLALLNLGHRGLPMTPELLARDFGSETGSGRVGVAAFASALAESSEQPKVEAFFRQWRILFGEVCGYDVQNPGAPARELAEHYGLDDRPPADVLFALHTYYAVFMKLLAAHVATFFQRIGASPLDGLQRAASSTALKREMEHLEDGSIFADIGVSNFLEGDLFAWYLAAWNEPIETAIRTIVTTLLEYSPGSLRDNPAQARDLLKRLYHELFPRQVRHALGEYYTPDWLADYTLDRAEYDGNPRTRIVDPACGSGTFLVLALARVQRWLERNYEHAPPINDLTRMVQDNIQGFDLNPLAVLAARTNFLIQFYDLFDYRGRLEIPVYLCDSVLTPFEFSEPAGLPFPEAPFRVPTSAKLFEVPRHVVERREDLTRYADLLADYARHKSGFTADDFVARCRDEGIDIPKGVIEDQHRRLFADVRELDRDRRNGVWARFIKNAFAPIFLRQSPVDLVVGNPPWVNWESLPGRMEAEGGPNYRQQIAAVFERYGLFSLTGAAGRLGGGKKDLSMLFVYACIDHYLKNNGRLAFVITQTVFKTKGAGDGFRRFKFDAHNGHRGRATTVHVAVDAVDDFSSFQPFEGATNRTAVLLCRKSSRPIRYPVTYRQWRKVERGRVGQDFLLQRVIDATSRVDFAAAPIDEQDATSPWMTAPGAALSALRKVSGASQYVAHAGTFTGGLNGCYWVQVQQEVPDGVIIENLFDVGKIKVERVRTAIEPDLIYPLLRGRDVGSWRAQPSASIIISQDFETRRPIPEPEMRRNYPRTYAYLKGFEDQLRQRRSSSVRKLMEDAFYAMFAIGPYTLAPWKVVWREQSARPQAAVVGPADDRPILPDHKLMLVDCGDRAEEAHYLCALLNSAPARLLIMSYVISTSTSTHVVHHVAIPRFSERNRAHRTLAELSQRAHEQARRGRIRELAATEEQLDAAAAELWGISTEELAAVQSALAPIAAEDGELLSVDEE